MAKESDDFWGSVARDAAHELLVKALVKGIERVFIGREITYYSNSNIVYVLLYNVGSSSEGIYTIKAGEQDTVIAFESKIEATNYALMLGKCDFPVPTVEAMQASEIEEFCRQEGYSLEFVPRGTDILPPTESTGIEKHRYFY